MPCGASRKRFGSTENFVQNGREVWALYEFLFVVDVKSLPLELQLQVYQSCKFYPLLATQEGSSSLA
jgi:hypothetical protein